jgi:RND family efflux transporter MFP subunit
MSPSPRRFLVGGVLVGLALALAVYGALHLAGYHFRRHVEAPPKVEERQPLCYISPADPGYIRFEPGKDDEGRELTPVYPTAPPPPGVPAPAEVLQYWASPMDPTYIRDKPGKDPMGHDLVPVYGEVAKPAPPPGVPEKERRIKYWISPMDPMYVRDQPGKAPCGMDLVPVYEEVGEVVEGAIAVAPHILQSMGVRTAEVELRPLTRSIRAVGKVVYDERQFSQVNPKINGWVERLYVKATGDPIRRGQALLSIYSPELVSTQQEYLLALKNRRTLEQSQFPELQESARRLVEAARQRLMYWDISPSQVADLERTGEISRTLTLRSPVHGIVTKRLVTEGQYVTAGMPLLEVADLSTVWVEADVYEYELPWVKVGQHAHMTLQYLPGETFHGDIRYIYPYLSEATRTARVRLAFPNPKLILKPDMFAQVNIVTPVAEHAVAVPAEAIMDTGERQHVFVALGGGQFEPREVQVGLHGDDGWRQILSGLKPGEEVVTSAQFLLDSESRFREAVAKMLPPPVIDDEVPPRPPVEPPPAPPPIHRH